MGDPSTTIKPLVSFEDLGSNIVKDEELDHLFGKQLKFDEDNVTIRDLLEKELNFTTPISGKDDPDSENDSVLSFEEEKIDEMRASRMAFELDPSQDELLMKKEVILSFEDLVHKMMPIRNDEKVMKRVLKKGSGDLIASGAFVTFHFNAYRDGEDEPYDSTLLRQQPWKVRLGRGEAIIGLEEALMSMKRNERSQFLIHYDLAYGQLGCPPRVPKLATLMYEITVVDFMDEKVADIMESQNSDADFETILKAAIKDQTTGVAFFRKQSYRPAISSFRQALRRLENCDKIKNEQDSVQQHRCMLKLYMNLAVCYNKDSIQEPPNACKMCQEALKIDPNNSKAQFHYGKALIALGDYKEAKRRLLLAKAKSPNDEIISYELVKLQEKAAKAIAREKDMALNMFKGITHQEKPSTEEKVALVRCKKSENQEDILFRQEIKSRLDSFVNKKIKRLEFPSDLTINEVKILEEEAYKQKLGFSKVSGDIGWHYVVSKSQ